MDSLSKVYENLGVLNINLQDYQQAIDYLTKALVISKEIGDKDVQGKCYGNLGVISAMLDKVTEAKMYFTKGLEIAKEIGDKELERNCLKNLSYIIEKQPKHNVKV